MTNAAANEPSCPFCDKQGLPILPLRYAIARADRGSAPALPAGFGQGVTSVKLPADIARYTLRLLRGGYLYTFDERRKEWRGYVVNRQSYLYEFDVYAKAPPVVGDKTFNDACKAQKDPYRARCFAVKDARNATKVWVKFSDVAWTTDVLKDYAGAILGTSTKPDAAERKQSLQCIDVAAWRSGKGLPHLATFDGLKHVAEFAADGTALHQDTREYFKRFMPPPYASPEDMLKGDEGTKRAFGLMSPMFRELLPGSVGKAPTEGQIDFAAWKFSHQAFRLTSKEAASLISRGNTQAKPLRPAMIGLFDPAGIAIELNGLAIQRSVEFTDHRDRRWKLETAQLIAGLKVAIGNGAVDARRTNAGLAYRALTAPSPMNAGAALANLFPSLRKAQEDAAAYVEKEERRYIDGHAEQIGDEAWASEYQTRLKPDAGWEQYLGKDGKKGDYGTELEAFANSTLRPLDQSYMDWLRSQSIVQVFKFHYDPKDLRSGESYLELAQLLIGESGGRQAVAACLADVLRQDPSKPEAWLVRSLVMNYDPLIKEWKKGALDNATQSALTWADAADKLHGKLKDIFTSAAAGGVGSRYFDKVARLLYQIGGPLIEQLSKDIDKGIGAALTTRMQMSLLGSVAKASNPDLMVFDLRGMWNRKEAAKTLAHLLASVGGGNENQYRSGARAVLDGIAGLEGAPRPYHAVLLLDRAKAKALLPGLSGKAMKAGVAEVLTPAQFNALLDESVGKVAHLEFKAGVVQLILSSITLNSAYDDMIKAKPGDKTHKTVNFAGGVIGLIGAMSATVGGALERTAWGASPLSAPFSVGAIHIVNRAGWLIGIGKLLGAIGGVIGGAIAAKEGWAMLGGNQENLGLVLITAGVVSGGLSLAVLFFTISVPISILIGLIVAIVMIVVAWLTPNKVQDWLEKSLYFGKGRKENFNGPLSQSRALEELAKGG